MVSTIDNGENRPVLQRTVDHFRPRGIPLPAFTRQRDPRLVPEGVRRRLSTIGLRDLDPLNLLRITWKHVPVERGGGFAGVSCLELPRSLTGVRARIRMLAGKWFATGARRVRAAYGSLVPRSRRRSTSSFHEEEVVVTDSGDLYRSRLAGLTERQGEYTRRRAELDFSLCLAGQHYDDFPELGHAERERIHNLKSYPRIEQQKELGDLNRLWAGRGILHGMFTRTERWDEMIEDFSRRAGLAEQYR